VKRSGAIAARFVIRHAGVLMPARNRLVFKEQSWSCKASQAIPARGQGGEGVAARSMTKLAEHRTVNWTGEGWIYIHNMINAEKRYKAMELL